VGLACRAQWLAAAAEEATLVQVVPEAVVEVVIPVQVAPEAVVEVVIPVQVVPEAVVEVVIPAQAALINRQLMRGKESYIFYFPNRITKKLSKISKRFHRKSRWLVSHRLFLFICYSQ